MFQTDEERWQWPRYSPPGLLIGPLLHIRQLTGWYVPDYNKPGVSERIKIEVDFLLDQERYKD